MQLARIRRAPGRDVEIAAYRDGKLLPLGNIGFADIASLLAAGPSALQQARQAADRASETLSPDQVEFLPPTSPGIFLGLGYNYKALASAEGVPFNKHPELFAKLPNCVIGHGHDVVVPKVIDKVDYESELGVVIGRRASRVTVGDALSFVGGYTCVNDLTAKLIPRPQESGSIVVPLKCADNFGPLGPVLVTADEIPDPQKLTMLCRVNGVEKQRYPTSDMVHTVAEVVAYITERITLSPGDVISMGTSLGIGIIKKPPEFLKPGDVMEIQIENYPALRNRIEWEKH